MEIKKISSEKTAIHAVFWLSMVLAGLYHSYMACLASGIMAVALAVHMIRHGRLRIRWNLSFAAVLALTAGYGLSCIWAVDRGMALIGFFQFAGPLVFLLLMMQYPEEKTRIKAAFPYAMAILTVASVGLSLIPSLSRYFLVADRLAGFLQYPNTFALLLLTAELMLISTAKRSVRSVVVLLILLVGILYTGSRTVFALGILANLAYALTRRTKKQALLMIGGIAAVVATILLVAMALDQDVLNRYLRFSALESTFAGRLLYWTDALPWILAHPFGSGYGGYYYVQQSFQTGVYSVMHLHNDLLQMMFDVGWIPAVLWAVAVIRSIIRNKKVPVQSIILAVLFVHSLFDFDLQFVAMYFVFFLFVDTESGKERVLACRKTLAVGAVALACCCIYMSAATLLPEIGQRSAGNALYPWNTRNQTQILIEAESVQDAFDIADDILQHNSYVTVAYSAKCSEAYSRGDFLTFIETKRMILERFPFHYAEYEDYCRKLISGIEWYRANGDSYSANVCIEELVATEKKLNALTSRVSALGSVIADQPITQLPQELSDTIRSLQSGI